MKAIWKFPFNTTDEVILEMPLDAEILCVQTQSGCPCIWAKVETDFPKEKRLFHIYGTGHTLQDEYEMKYLGTYQQMSGALIFHVFEILK